MNLRDTNEQRRINNRRKLHTESWLKILIIPILKYFVYDYLKWHFYLYFSNGIIWALNIYIFWNHQKLQNRNKLFTSAFLNVT